MARTIKEMYFDTYANFPTTGSTTKIYIATDSNVIYRWNWSWYVQIWKTWGNFTTSSDPALNAAVTTAIIDAYDWVVITLTWAWNNQTLQAPTVTTSWKQFLTYTLFGL